MGLPITPSEYGKLEEVTNSFVFRNSGEFKIPKAKREIAFTMAVDIQIQSVSWNVYENRKSNPPIEFYGYATFVEQDAIRYSIPIIFPRQRLYFAIQDDAIRQWNELAKYWEHWQLHRWNEIKILEIQGAIGIEDIVDFTPQFGDSNWIELPLREVYIKCPNGTQFEVQYTQYQPVPYEDPFGNTRNGISNQLDGDKDNGLPEEGIQPRQNSPSNPFEGNEPETPPSVESGFFLNPDKLDDLTQSGTGIPRWVGFVHNEVSSPPVCQKFNALFWYALPPDGTASVLFVRSIGVRCGEVIDVVKVQVNGTDVSPEIFLFGSYSLIYSFDFTKPDDIFQPV